MTSPLVDNLRALAAQLEEAGQPLLAIKCLTVCLQESPVVTDEIVISMHLARLLMERCTDSLTQAKQKLLHAVSTHDCHIDWTAAGAGVANPMPWPEWRHWASRGMPAERSGPLRVPCRTCLPPS